MIGTTVLSAIVAGSVAVQVGMFVRRKIRRMNSPSRKRIPAKTRRRLYGLQSGKCEGCWSDLPLRNLEVDHIVPISKGGTDDFDNLQLLCGTCNRIKGDRDMEFLEGRAR